MAAKAFMNYALRGTWKPLCTPACAAEQSAQREALECFLAKDEERVEMLMCHKVTHKNLVDSHPLFRSNSELLVKTPF